jgi:hypothetical protein
MTKGARMDRVPIARLEREWRRSLADSTVADSLRRWQVAEPALRPFSDVAGALRFLRASVAGERQDAVLRALVSCAVDDPAAGRVVLHALLPGLKRLSARLLMDERDQEELWSALLSAAWERIRRYPIDRRPRRIAANVLLDTMHDTVSAHHRRMRDRAELDVSSARLSLPAQETDRDVEALVAGAVRAGAVNAAEAELILRTRIDGESLVSLARTHRTGYDALRLRRRRAERRLLLHLGLTDVRSGAADRLLGRARVAGRGSVGPAGGSEQSSH